MTSAKILSSIPKATKRKSGSKVPEITDIPDTVRKAVDKFVKVKSIIKTHTELKTLLETTIIAHAMEEQTSDALEDSYHKSYTLSGMSKTSPSQVTYSRSDKFSPISEDSIPELKKIFGSRFPMMFERELQLSVAPAVFESKDLLKDLATRLQAAFGADLGKFFVKEEVWTARAGLDVEQYRQGTTKVERLDRYEQIQELVVQTKPSLKA
jgi:hypothetical protein